MRRFLLLLIILLNAALLPVCPATIKNGRVLLIVWDGMRPDFVTEENTPTLSRLAQEGVTFQNHHAVYLSSTEVNGTALATGAYPSHSSIVANNEYRPDIDPLKAVHTEGLETIRQGDLLKNGLYLNMPTIAEIVRANGGRIAVSGAKPVALLADRGIRSTTGLGPIVFAGETLPPTLAKILAGQHGKFPDAKDTKRTRNDWTTEVMLDSLWKETVPTFSLLWLNEPDYSQHYTGPGSDKVLAGIRNADQNLARVLKRLDSNWARNMTDVIVVSDHGCSTISARVDLVEELKKNGIKATREFKTKPADDDVLIVSNGGSTMIYVIGHGKKTIRQIVNFLQNWEHTGVIFTRKAMPGTFALRDAQVNSDSAPDIVVSMRWTADKNAVGTPGMITAEVSGFNVGQGLHVSLSPFDMHNTLIAAGPSFRKGITSPLPSGNIDIAPTILWILGIKQPKPMDGRVLTEGLSIKGPKLDSFESRKIEATTTNDNGTWHQYLNYKELNGVIYLDEGNGKQLPKQTVEKPNSFREPR